MPAQTATFAVWRGDDQDWPVRETCATEVSEGMVVLDAVHQIQAEQANDLAVRWNCKAGKVRLVLGRGQRQAAADVHDAAESRSPLDKPVTVEPMRRLPADQGPRHRRLVELRVKKRHQAVHAAPPDAADGTWRMQQVDVDRVQEFRKCIECFLCQDVCHVLRDHHMYDRVHRPASSASTRRRSRCIRSTPTDRAADR